MAYNNNNNKKKRNFKKNNNNNQKQPVKKNTYVKIQVPIAYSEFYSRSIDSLYNILNEITFDKIVISVKAYRNIIFNNPDIEGSMNIGSIVKFNNDNTFTISVSEKFAKTISEGNFTIVPYCRKDFDTNEITSITDLYLSNKSKSIDEYYKDIESAFTDEEDSEESADVCDANDADAVDIE